MVPFLLCFGGYSLSQVEPEEVIITKPAEDSADLNTFYDELSKDGEWIKVDKDEIDSEENLELSETVEIDEDIITEYVWRPRVSFVYVDWNPYTYGHWEFTRFGWVWVSDYEWGWGPYHYGRWWFSVRWGWVWSPGHRWAPCWVSWCHSRHHIGWHPISPRTRWRHHKGVIITHPVTPRQKSITNKWTFVKKEDFTKKVTKDLTVDLKNNKNLISDAKITTSAGEIYNTGPKKYDIEKSTGTKITTKNVSVVDSKGTTKYTSKKQNNTGDYNTSTKKKEESVSKTGERQTNKNNKSDYKQENTNKSPNTKRENNNRNSNTKKESTKSSETNKEKSKNSNTKKESNSNTKTKNETSKAPTYNPGSDKNSNSNKETYKPPTYNPGNSNKNSSPNRETSKPPTYNPGNSNKSGNSNNGSKPNNSPGNNSGNSNKSSSPPPKKNNS